MSLSINYNSISPKSVNNNETEMNDNAISKNSNVLSDIKTDISEWLNDEDKVCKDGNDDGNISAKEALKSFGKGLFGIVKTAVNHPFATMATIAAGAAITVASGGAALPVMVAAGVVCGGVQIGTGIYGAVTADSDAKAKESFEKIGNGTFSAAASVLGAKSALKSASTAGVSSAQNTENMNAIQATMQCFKSAPEAVSSSLTNVKANFLTLKTGVIQKNSNKLQGGQQATSKATTADVKKIDLSGSTDEILQKYSDSGIFYKDGNYYIPNKWNADEPYLVTNDSVLMKYGDDDFAVCASSIFDKTYGTTESYASGNFQYSNADSLSTEEYINATKQAKSSYVKLDEGTKVQTLEGVRTVGADDVAAIDVDGNPYIQPEATFNKKNVLQDIVTPVSNKSRAVEAAILTSSQLQEIDD